jgi:peptidoglycan-N-acetylglucosamine deacetylase
MLGRLQRELTTAFSREGWLPIAHRLPARPRRIAISFDDGPTPATTPRLLEILRRFGATATFFLVGSRAEAHPELVRAIVEAGHAAYAHGYSHRRLDGLTEAEVLDELTRTEALIARHRPAPSPYLVRLPYGAGHRSARMHRLLRAWRADCQLAHWSYNTEDFRLAEDCLSLPELQDRCRAAVRRALAQRRFVGSVVLMHEDPFEARGALAAETGPILLHMLLEEASRRGVGATCIEPLARQSRLARHLRTVPMA